MSQLILYGSNVADAILTTACDMAAASGGTETSQTSVASGGLAFFEIWSKGNAAAPSSSTQPAPTGNGWVFSPGAGSFDLGNWSATLALTTVAITAASTFPLRFYKYSGGIYTSIGSISATLISNARNQYTFTATSMPATSFATGDLLYVDLWVSEASTSGGDSVQVWESNSSTAGVASDMQITTANWNPTTTGVVKPTGEVRPRWVPRALSARLFQPFIELRAWVDRGITANFVRPTSPVNVPHYVRRGLTNLLMNFRLGMSFRLLLGLVKDTALRLRLGKPKDAALRFRLGSLRDTVLRFRIKSAGLLKDIALRLRLGSLRDAALRLLLGKLNDSLLRMRLKSADQSKDASLRLLLTRGVTGLPAWVDRAITGRFIRNVSPVNIPRYVRRGLTSLLSNYAPGLSLRLGLVKNYYVSTLGSDTTGDGSKDRPWATPQKAASMLTGGETVWVADGTYVCSTQITITASGADDKHRTVFRSTNLYGAKIINQVPVIGNQLTDQVFSVLANYVDIIGFDISGVHGRIGVYAYGINANNASPNGNRIRVLNCYIHDIGALVDPSLNCFGIDLGQHDVEAIAAPGYDVVDSCIVLNIGQRDQPGCHPIYAAADHMTVTNNIVGDCAGFGINNFHYPHHNVISNNLVFNCGTNNTVPPQGGGIYLSSSSTGIAEKCDFNIVANNIIRDCSGYAGIYEEDPTENANNTYSNNSFFGNGGTTNGNVLLQSGATNANPLTIDPLLLNYQRDGTGNYHLLPNSPLIDAGLASTLPVTDFDGVTRVHTNIGPYEFQPPPYKPTSWLPMLAWVDRALTASFVRPTNPVNIPRYVRLSLTHLLANFQLGMQLRFILVSGSTNLKDAILRLRLGSLRDVTLRLRLGSLRDLVLRFRLKSADQLRDLTLRLRLGSLRDIALRLRLGVLKDAALRLRLRSADQLRDLALRLRLGSLRDAALRLKLAKLNDAILRFRLATPGLSVRDMALRLRLMSANILKDTAIRLRLGKLKDANLRLILASLRNVVLRLRLGLVRDLPLRLRLMSASVLKDLVLRMRLGKVRDVILRLNLISGAPIPPFGISSSVHPALAFSEVGKSTLTQTRVDPTNYILRSLGSTLVEATRSAISTILTLIGAKSVSLPATETSKTSLVFSHGVQVMPAPLTTILSTITVTDVNNSLVSNLSTVSLVITFPDQSITTLTMAGGGITNMGAGQYQAKYDTKMPGPTREVWSAVAADGTTKGSYQFDIGVGY